MQTFLDLFLVTAAVSLGGFLEGFLSCVPREAHTRHCLHSLPQEPGGAGTSEGGAGAGAHPGSLCLPVKAAPGDSGHRCDFGHRSDSDRILPHLSPVVTSHFSSVGTWGKMAWPELWPTHSYSSLWFLPAA